MSRRAKEIPLAEVGLRPERPQARLCASEGCEAPGTCRVTRSPQALDEHLWLCQGHAAEHNRAWNYFEGWSEPEIERYRVESVTGHRPTWRLGARGFTWYNARIHSDFGDFDETDTANGERIGDAAAGDPRRRAALATLDLSPSASLHEVKMRYKQLVKRFHPDANGGDKAAEERFKEISEAYSYLKSCDLA